MRVKMPLGMRIAIGRALMKPHGIRKRYVEQVVVTRCYSMKDVDKRIAPGFRKLFERAHVSIADDDRFERPNCPEWYDRRKLIVPTNDAPSLIPLDLQILA